MPEGTYKLETQVSNGGTDYWFGGEYMDGGEGGAAILTLTPTAEPLGNKADNTPVYAYTIANGDNYYGNATSGTLLGQNVAADSNDALWLIIPFEEAKAYVSRGTVDDPTDATVFIEDFNFNRNNRFVDSWQGWGDQVKVGGGNCNNNAESYERVFDVYQELSGLPNGVYELNAQAAVTFHDNRAKKAYDGVDMPVVYMGDETSEFNEMIEADQLTSQAQLAQKFINGNYKVEPLFVQVTDGTLKIGATSVRADIWAVWDNFVLTYYGSEATIDQVKNAAILAEMNELKAKAEGLVESTENADVKTALNDAIAQAAAAEGADAINAAIEALKGAIDSAEALNIAKNILPKMKELVESTNVYTAEAYEAYYGQWQAKYDAGTITKAEASALQDPFVVTGWHDNITCDNFLLSAWDTEADQFQGYYINSWSTEGVEGSNNYEGVPFGVPFFEYWTNDANSLGEKTMTATMTGLPAGTYDITALVRVRLKNGDEAPAVGIKLQVNDGRGVNVCDGEQIGTSQSYLKEVAASGEVGEDGVLNIKFIVNGDNNVSWLSFKNVLFKKQPKPEDIEITLSEGDISEALAAAKAAVDVVRHIDIYLTEGANVTLSATIEAPNSLGIIGNNATITVAEGMTDPFITLNGTESFATKSDGTDSDHKYVKEVSVTGVTLKGLQGAFIKDAQKTYLDVFDIEDCNIQMPNATKNVIDFASKGYVGFVFVNNSTIWASEKNEGYFAQYGSRPKNINENWTQEFILTNNTIVNIANGKNFCNFPQKGTAQNAYNLQNNIFVDCGKQNQVVVGFNSGQASATPAWNVSGNYFEWGGACVNAEEIAKAGQKDGQDIVQNCVDGTIAFTDAANGDFNGLLTLAEGAVAPESIGASEWTISIYKEPFVFPEGAVVYDFAAAAEAGENPANKNGSAGNGQAFYGWENPEKTDSKRQDYKGYEWAEGSVLPEECHVWRRSDRINGNVADGGLKCPSNKEMAVDGLVAGNKVIIVYDATGAAEDSQNIIWAIGDGSSDETLTDPRATATIDGIEAVTGETTIASGAEILVNSVTPAENGSGYIVFQVKKGMIIQQIGIVPPSGDTTGIETIAAGQQAAEGIYNLSGQKVVKAGKGLYIINGKKVVK